MKHNHNADVNVKVGVDIPKDDIESVIDKVTESVVIIVAVTTAAHIFRKWFA